MKENGKAGKRKCEPEMPKDEPSFICFVRGLNRRISRLSLHLTRLSNVHDYRARGRLERMIDLRGKALCQPPESVSEDIVRALREEIRNA